MCGKENKVIVGAIDEIMKWQRIRVLAASGLVVLLWALTGTSTYLWIYGGRSHLDVCSVVLLIVSALYSVAVTHMAICYRRDSREWSDQKKKMEEICAKKNGK